MLHWIQMFVRRLLQTCWIAVRALQRNTLRSCLTALGIIIGVASVVAMVAVGNGAQARITHEISAMGQNLLMVFAGSKRSGGANSGLGSASTITLDDASAIGRELKDVAAISPEDSTTAQAIASGRNWSTSIVGESSDYLKIRDWKLVSGSMFTERDVQTNSKVVVIGSKTANELFGPFDPVGQKVRIRNIPFVIIGCLESKGGGMGGQNQDDRIIIPYTTSMKRITGNRFVRSVNVEIISPDRMQIAQQQITSLLRQRHHLTTDQDDDFDIFNQKQVADTVDSVSLVITLLLGAVAGISLLVGGIGIMNIMLVSVTERTREIGIRIAVGATPADIRLQFLIEAVTLSLLGGGIGVLGGIGASKLLGAVADFQAVVSAGSILLAFGVSSMIGIFFGLYPAHKAASLNPIEALRYE